MTFSSPALVTRLRYLCIPLFLSAAVFCTVATGLASSSSTSKSSEKHSPRHVMAGDFIFSDLFTTKPEASARFYKKVFGWDFGFASDGSRGVMVITMNDRYVGNAITVQSGEGRTRWLCFIAVPDVERTLQRVKKFGGLSPGATRTVRGRGIFALVRDPSNAAFAVTMPSPYLTLPPAETPSAWAGSELWTTDVVGTMEFYASLFGYDSSLVPAEGGRDIAFLRKGGKLKATITEIPWNNTNEEWIPYVYVQDVAATCARVTQAGGKVLVETEKGERIGQTALIADPQGGVIGIQQVPR